MPDLADTALEKNERLQKRNNKINIIIIAVIFVGFIIYSLVGKGGSSQGLRFSENGMIITDNEGNETTVLYSDMQDVTLVEEAQYGEAVSGTTSGFLGNRTMIGVFSSEMFGQYTAACSPKIKSAIWIKTQNASYVINVENDQSTASLYEATQKMLSAR